MDTKKTLNALLAGAVMMTVAGAASSAMAEGTEKCYGVVKAGQNGCASADGSHSCAGHATEDGNANEWIALPAGVCDKLAHGSTEAGHGDEHAEEHGDHH